MLRLPKIDRSVGIGRSVILPIIVTDSDLIQIQAKKIFPVIVVQCAIPAISAYVTLQKLRIHSSLCTGWRTVNE